MIGRWALFLLLLPLMSFGQSGIEVTASVSDNVVYVGERFVLNVEVKGNSFKNVSRPDVPDISPIEILNPNPSTSTSFEFINGKASSKYTYSYYVVCRKDGTFSIPSIKVSVDRKVYETSPITVRVASRKSSSTPNQAGQSQNGKTVNELPEIFLEMELSTDKPVVGEQITADVVLYFKSTIDVQSYQPVPGWKADGFWKEELNDGRQPQAVSIIREGQRYRKATLMRYALFPSKSGKLKLSPYQINTTIRYSNVSRDPFASFFGGFGANQKSVELETEAIDLDVKTIDDPSGEFIGAVGQFQITRQASVKEALVGESIEIVTTIFGTGNIALVTKPKYPFPDDFEVYKPQETQSINRRGSQISGRKIFTDIIIGRRPGVLEVPAQTVAYFDNVRKRLIKQTLPAITVNIKQDPRYQAQAGGPSLSLNLQPIVGLASWRSPAPTNLKSYWWLWTMMFTSVVILAGGYARRQHLIKMGSDPLYARRNRADKRSVQLFSQADALVHTDVKGAYGALHKALSGFICDKVGLPQAGLSDAQIVEGVKGKLEETLVSKLNTLLNKCSTIRYAPVISEKDYDKDRAIAEEIFKALRSGL